MDKREAEELLALIERDAQTGPAEAYQIGNGEFTVRLKARGYFLWSLADYRSYLDMKEQERQARREERKQELITV